MHLGNDGVCDSLENVVESSRKVFAEETVFPMVEPVYLSPHLDDVVLSCAGSIFLQAQIGRLPLIVTVFAGTPDYSRVSGFARRQHNYWGNRPDPMAVRRREDLAAAHRLNATARHLEFLDAVYRSDSAGHPLYPSEEAIFGPLAEEDRSLVVRVAGQLRDLIGAEASGPTCLYVPLGLGNHVDHQVVRAAAEHRVDEGLASAVYYEEMPYAARSEQPPEDVEVTQMLRPRLEPLSEAAVQAKLEAIACYSSQLNILFGGLEQMRMTITAFGQRYAANGAAAGERYWTTLERNAHAP